MKQKGDKEVLEIFVSFLKKESGGAMLDIFYKLKYFKLKLEGFKRFHSDISTTVVKT